MPPARRWTDEHTLLCERCGYVVEGLPTEGACPECGKPIAESLPDRRTGTPWQQEPGLGALLATWCCTVMHPHRTLNDMRPDGPAGGLRLATIWIAAVIFMLSGVLAPILADMRNPNAAKFGPALLERGPAVIVSLVLGLPLVVLVLDILTRVNAIGLLFLGRSCGFRITHSIASMICDHGAIGWLLASLGGSLTTLVLVWLESAPGRTLPAWTFAFPLGLAVLGFLYFESFGWLGLRRLRYANSPRPEAATGITGS